MRIAVFEGLERPVSTRSKLPSCHHMKRSGSRDENAAARSQRYIFDSGLRTRQIQFNLGFTARLGCGEGEGEGEGGGVEGGKGETQWERQGRGGTATSAALLI